MANIEPLIKCFIDCVCAGKCNETPKTYRGKLTRFETWLGNRDLTQLTQTDLESFRIYLQTRKTKQRGKKEVNGGLSLFTIRSICVTSKHFLHWCYQQGHMQADLAAGWKIPSAPKPEPKAIAQATFEKLLSAVCQVGTKWEQARNLALLYVFRDSGGRISCVLDAELDDIDMKDLTIWSHSKGKPYPLYINPPTKAALQTWLQLRHLATPCDYKIFTGAKNSGLTRSGVYHVLNKLAEVGKIEGRKNPHSFRHAFARDTLKAGADLSQVSQLMVHTSIVVTADYYTRWDDAELKAVHQKYGPGRRLPDPAG